MKCEFEIRGEINAETVDEAIDILQLLLENDSITITKLDINTQKRRASVFLRSHAGRMVKSLDSPYRCPPEKKQKLEGKGEMDDGNCR